MISSSSCAEVTSVLLNMMIVVAVMVIVAMVVTKAMMPLLSPAAAFV